MTLGEFRTMSASLPDDTVIFIKGQDEYTRADHYGVGVKDVLISSGCDRIDLADAADFDTVEEFEEWKTESRLTAAKAIMVDASD